MNKVTKDKPDAGFHKNQTGVPSQVVDSAPEMLAEASGRTFGRTFLLKLLVIGYLVLAWFGGVRCFAVFAYGDLLSTYLSQSELVYIALSGAAWGLAGLAAAAFLWLGASSATRFSTLTGFGCFLWYWIDYLFLAQTPLSQTNWPFALVGTLLALGLACWIPTLPKESKFLHRKSIH